MSPGLSDIDYLFLGLTLWFLFNCIVFWVGSGSDRLPPKGRTAMRLLMAKYAIWTIVCAVLAFSSSLRFPILSLTMIGMFVLSGLLFPVVVKIAIARNHLE